MKEELENEEEIVVNKEEKAKEVYTQTEVSKYLGKSLANLAFYKDELREKGYIVKEKNKELITKEGFDYLKLRFSSIEEKKIKPIEDEQTTAEEKTSSTTTDISKGLLKKKEKYEDQEIKVDGDLKENLELKLEIEKLKFKLNQEEELNDFLKKENVKWQKQADSWAEKSKEADQDKECWRSFAVSQLEEFKSISSRLLPENTATKPEETEVVKEINLNEKKQDEEKKETSLVTTGKKTARKDKTKKKGFFSNLLGL